MCIVIKTLNEFLRKEKAPWYEEEKFPAPGEVLLIVLGYQWELLKQVKKWFGTDASFTKSVEKWFDRRDLSAGPPLGSPIFTEAFDEAQKKLLTWAGVDPAVALRLT